MQSIAILHLDLTQIHPLLRLIDRSQIDGKEIMFSAFIFVTAARPNVDAALLAKVLVRGVEAGVVA